MSADRQQEKKKTNVHVCEQGATRMKKKNEKLTDLNSEIYAENESLILSCQQNK